MDSGEGHAAVRLHGVLAWVDVVPAGEGEVAPARTASPTLGGVAWKELFPAILTLVSRALRAGLLPGEAFISCQRLAFNEQRLKSA